MTASRSPGATPACGPGRGNRRFRRPARRRRKHRRRRRFRLAYLHLVPGVVQRRPDEVVHGRIHHHEILRLAGLHVLDPGQQHAGIADDASGPGRRSASPCAAAERAERAVARTRAIGRGASSFGSGCRCRRRGRCARARCRRAPAARPARACARPRRRRARLLRHLRADVAADADEFDARAAARPRGTGARRRRRRCRTCSRFSRSRCTDASSRRRPD